jgi:hypothetical protein
MLDFPWHAQGSVFHASIEEIKPMNAKTGASIKMRLLSVCAMLAMLGLPPAASASPIRINFSGVYNFGNDSGDAFSGYADLQLQNDPAASATFPSVPNPLPAGPRVDPEGAQTIAGAAGYFDGHAITGVQMLNGAAPSPGEYLPASYSALLASNTPDGSPAVSFDNLFYLGGSPVTCIGINPDGSTTALYPFAGGLLDPYGVLFTLDDGSLLDLWSNGVMPGLGLNYGAILFAPADENFQVLSAQFNGARVSVPEPGLVWLFGAAVLGLFVRRRSAGAHKQASRTG